MQIIAQCLPDSWTGNSKCPTPIQAETVSRHNEVMTPGRTKTSSTDNIGVRNAVVRQVPGSLMMKTVMHHRHELELHSFRHVKSMKVVMSQTAIELLHQSVCLSVCVSASPSVYLSTSVRTSAVCA